MILDRLDDLQRLIIDLAGMIKKAFLSLFSFLDNLKGQWLLPLRAIASPLPWLRHLFQLNQLSLLDFVVIQVDIALEIPYFV